MLCSRSSEILTYGLSTLRTPHDLPDELYDVEVPGGGNRVPCLRDILISLPKTVNLSNLLIFTPNKETHCEDRGSDSG